LSGTNGPAGSFGSKPGGKKLVTKQQYGVKSDLQKRKNSSTPNYGNFQSQQASASFGGVAALSTAYLKQNADYTKLTDGHRSSNMHTSNRTPHGNGKKNFDSLPPQSSSQRQYQGAGGNLAGARLSNNAGLPQQSQLTAQQLQEQQKVFQQL
jgi:hypothetical protein